MQVAVDHRRAEVFGQRLTGFDGVAHDHTATGDDHRVLRRRQNLCSFGQALLATGAALDTDRRGDLDVDIAVEEVTRNVQLGRTVFLHRPIEATAGQFRHSRRVRHMGLVLGDGFEERQLLGFLEATEALAQRAGFGRDHHHRAVRPVSGGNGGDEVGDAGAVLRDAHAVSTTDPREAVGHVTGALLVDHRDKTDAGRSEDIHRIHKGRTHDAKDVGDAVGNQCFNHCFAGGHAWHIDNPLVA